MRQVPKQPATIPSHTFEPTSDRHIMRFVDRDGDWTHYWIKNQKLFVPAVNHIIRLGYPKGERFYNYLLRATPDEAERKLKTAGEEGSRTHEAIRDLIMGDTIDFERRYYNELSDRYEPLSADEWVNLESFVNWAAKYQPRVLFTETTIWSQEFLYAGTIDFIGTITVPAGDKLFGPEFHGKEILILLDWKTSSGIWDEYELQIAAYRTAALEYLRNRLPIRQYGGLWTGIVRIGTSHKEGFEMRVWNDGQSEANFELFLSALDIYKKKSGDEFEPTVRQIPAQFSIKIPKLRARRRRTTVQDDVPNPKHFEVSKSTHKK
jgi:hypothetical protein